MKRIIIILICSNISIGQSLDRVEKNLYVEEDFKSDNFLEDYKSFEINFSKVWTRTENQNILGIIGKGHQRIHIKLISVFRISANPFVYNVYGKSKVKNTICEFYGNIVIKEIREFKKPHFGVDNEYADKGIQKQGVLIATYEFFENKEQHHSGILRGKLYSRWYLNSENNIEYDNIEFNTDGYINNAYVGIWENYTTGKAIDCNWADYRVPKANSDFDIGIGEFAVSEKYAKKGWLDKVLKNNSSNLTLKSTKKDEKQKEWWE